MIQESVKVTPFFRASLGYLFGDLVARQKTTDTGCVVRWRGRVDKVVLTRKEVLGAKKLYLHANFYDHWININSIIIMELMPKARVELCRRSRKFGFPMVNGSVPNYIKVP